MHIDFSISAFLSQHKDYFQARSCNASSCPGRKFCSSAKKSIAPVMILLLCQCLSTVINVCTSTVINVYTSTVINVCTSTVINVCLCVLVDFLIYSFARAEAKSVYTLQFSTDESSLMCRHGAFKFISLVHEGQAFDSLPQRQEELFFLAHFTSHTSFNL